MPPPTSADSPTDRPRKLEELRAIMRRHDVRQTTSADDHASSWRRLVGGVRPRRLVDCLAASPGSGGGLVALRLCSQACAARGELVVVDPSGNFYPPAAIAWGVDARRLLVVSPPSEIEALAAVEIALRSPAVAAVWASLGAIPDRAFRRLLLAAEAGAAFGALVRPGRYEAQPSWGDVQLRFTPVPTPDDHAAPFRVRVAQTRNRHGPAGGEALLAIDERTGEVTELPQEHHDQRPTPNALRVDARLAHTTRSA